MSKRYALCGLSNRGVASFALPLLGVDRDGSPTGQGHTDVAMLVAAVEPDVARFDAFNAWLAEHELPTLRRYDTVADLVAGEQVAGEQVDALIVASPDHTHLGHIRDGLAHDLEVLTEKPMVTTTAEAAEVLRLERASRGRVLVTHNFRYPPRHVQVKELIRSGRIGRVVQVLLEYHVDTSHGSSYFVRWNRTKAASGGLTLHKSTHHLDLIGWLIDDEPVRVAASGGRFFYGPDSPHRPSDAEGQPLSGQELLDADPYWQEMLRRGAITEPEAGQPRRGVLDLPYVEQYPADSLLSVYDDEVDSLDTVTSVIT
ncbi:MAG TPA: Gfo/Idh/MocA family oxidoreductase, partial [Candidatus Avipropionibacterium avicola]|nr:Gfo/Idh/MocA family oxidoreductase [Candidatus Avipropionibacterium avicola]